MKNPNGYGSVVNLGKRRRKPFGVRITTGYDDKGKQIFKYIGYFENRKAAMQALAEYNINPYDVQLADITLKEVMDMCMKKKENRIESGTMKTYRTYYNYLEPLHNKKINSIKAVELQNFIDSLSNLATGTLKRVKSYINMIFEQAMEMDIISKDYSKFIKLPKHKAKIVRKIFTEEEISLLWDNVKELRYADVILILIYTGMRVNELLKLPKSNVDLTKNIITGGSKTEAGKNRIIPIHPKILPLVIKRMENKTEYLIPNKTEKNYYVYNNFRENEFEMIMSRLGMEHTIHDTRHT